MIRLTTTSCLVIFTMLPVQAQEKKILTDGFIISSPIFLFAKEYVDTENPFDNLKQRDTMVLYLTCGSSEFDKYQAPLEELD